MQKNKLSSILSLLTCSLLFLQPVPVSAEAPPPDDDFAFDQITNWQFVFSSGVGAWGTLLTIQEDGSFQGDFHDTNMGETGEGYPNGTVYVSNFSGTFSEPEMINDYTAAFRLETLSTDQAPDTRTIVDGVQYIYTKPYGLENADTLYMYLPGAPTNQLPEEFLSWTGYWDPTQPEDEFLPFYGLYNIEEELGFYGFLMTEEPGAWDNDYGYIENEIQYAQEQAAPLEAALTQDLSQTELNLKSGELYQVWDDCLNEIWRYLKANLDADTMAALTDEEIDWIHAKEAAIKEAGQEFSGGSMQPLVENTTAVKWTKERIYELQASFGNTEWSPQDYEVPADEYGAVA